MGGAACIKVLWLVAIEPGDAAHDTGTISTEREAKKGGKTDAEIWLQKITAQWEAEEDWRKEAYDAQDVYEAADDAVSFNIFHSNVETLLPALYNSTPVPDVRRRFGDADPVAKMVVDVSERSLSFTIDQFDIDSETKAVIKDGEVAGRGCGKLRAHLKQYKCEYERVPWDRIILGPARAHGRLPWMAEVLFLTQEQVEDLAGKAVAKKLTYDCDVNDDGNARGDKKRDRKSESGIFKCARVYMVWDRKAKRIFWVADTANYKDFLKEVADPLNLPEFFPYRFYQPIKRLSSLKPVSPYQVYLKLLDELDSITARINKIIKTLRVRGMIAGELKADLERMQLLDDGEYVVSSNAMGLMKGTASLENAIAHWPLDPQVKALQQLLIHREQLKQTIYEVTGISDILRGASDSQETLGAQQIKTQWGSLRIQNRQEQVARLPREFFRDAVAVIGQHYPPDRISLMTSLPQKPEEQQLYMQALQVMQSPEMVAYKVDIETNSTIKADMARVQEQLTAFMGVTAQFVGAITQMITAAPMMIPLLLEVYTAFARNFKLGKQAEDALDQAQVQAPQMVQMIMQQQAGQQDPQLERDKQKHELDMQAKQVEVQASMAKADQEMQHAREMHEMAMQLKQVEAELAQIKAAIEAEQADRSLEHETAKASIDQEGKVIDLATRRRQGEQELRHGEEKHGQASRHAEGDAAQKQRHAEQEQGQKARHTEGEAAQDARHKEGEAKQKIAHQGAQAAIKTASAAAGADIKETGQKRDEAHAERVRAAEAKAVGAKGGNVDAANKSAAKKKRTKDIKLKTNAAGDVIGALIRDSEGDEVEIRIA